MQLSGNLRREILFLTRDFGGRHVGSSFATGSLECGCQALLNQDWHPRRAVVYRPSILQNVLYCFIVSERVENPL